MELDLTSKVVLTPGSFDILGAMGIDGEGKGTDEAVDSFYKDVDLDKEDQMSIDMIRMCKRTSLRKHVNTAK